MKSQRFIVAMLVVMMSGGVAVGVKEKAQISGTWKANCLVKITSEPEILPLNFDIVESIVLSSGVAVKAARETLDVSAESIDRGVKIEIIPLSSATTGKTKAGGGMMMPGGKKPGMEMMMMMRGSGGGGRTGAAPTVADEGTFLFRLEVELVDDVKPAAEELMKAVVANLRKTLDKAYAERFEQIRHQLAGSEDGVKGAQAELSMAMGKTINTADLETQEQLDKIVDLSMLKEDTTIAEAFDMLAGSVDPPLIILVHWSHLSENAFIEQDKPIEISGKHLPQLRLEKGLKLLLESVSAGGFAKLAYDLEDGVITIATADSLPPKQEELMRNVQMQPSMEMLIAKKHDLYTSQESHKMDIERMHARRQETENQMKRIRKEIANITANDVIIGELRKIVGISERRVKTVEKLLETGRTSAGELEDAQEKLARARIELAQQSRRISESAGGGQLNDFNKDLADLAILSAEAQVELRIINKQFQLVEKQLKEAATVNPQIHKIKSAQARLDEATNRVNALKRQLAGLVRPTVTILSAE